MKEKRNKEREEEEKRDEEERQKMGKRLKETGERKIQELREL